MERSLPARSPVGSLDILWRPFEALAGLARTSFQVLSRHRRLRIALLAGLVALPLLAGGWLLLRKSSFTAVEHVKVSGLHGTQAKAIETALTGAAEHMSTLDVRPGALRAGADAVLCASIFHYGQHTVAEVKEHLARAGVPVRLVE